MIEPGPELVFGIVAPLGIDLDQLIKILREELQRVGYRSTLIRLSSLLNEVQGLRTKVKRKPEDERIRTYMKAGTEIRSRTEVGGVLARLAVAAIQREREKITGSATKPDTKRAFILRSLKHRDEIQDLRDVYGDGFISISAYTPKHQREWALANLLAKSKPGTDKAKLKTIAADLIETDEAEEGKELGQNVEGAFPLADCFVEASEALAIMKV
jgi:cytidine deaminase